MGKFTVTHEINCDQATFWSRFFDKSFVEKFYLEALGYSECSILEQQETATEILRKLQVQPKWNLPGPLTKVLGSDYRYVEEGSFQKATAVWTWRQTPSVQANKIRVMGTLRVEPIGGNKVRRIEEIELEAKIFGIGGLIESTFEKQVRETADATAVYFNRSL